MVRVKVTVDVDPSLQHGLVLCDALVALAAEHYIPPKAKGETNEVRISVGVLQLMCAQRSAQVASATFKSLQVQFICRSSLRCIGV